MYSARLPKKRWSLYLLEQYYSHRWQCTMTQIASFDWKVYHTVYNKEPTHIQIYIIKLMTGWLPVYHHINKMLANKQKCPLCQNKETIGHLYQCPGRRQWQQKFLKNLRSHLQTIKTSADLSSRIITHFSTIIKRFGTILP